MVSMVAAAPFSTQKGYTVAFIEETETQLLKSLMEDIGQWSFGYSRIY
jgi:hypothetical protein